MCNREPSQNHLLVEIRVMGWEMLCFPLLQPADLQGQAARFLVLLDPGAAESELEINSFEGLGRSAGFCYLYEGFC